MAPAALDSFLRQTQTRAYRMALAATGAEADALDIVQDAMLSLVDKYARSCPSEWPLLFQRILQNRIKDHFRRRNRVVGLFTFFQREEDDDTADVTQHAANEHEDDPAQLLETTSNTRRVMAIVEGLPLRQQQVFLLRALEQFDVKQTAEAMQCTEGTVKTHYFRALQQIRTMMEAE